jgi:hypothetical protein
VALAMVLSVNRNRNLSEHGKTIKINEAALFGRAVAMMIVWIKRAVISLSPALSLYLCFSVRRLVRSGGLFDSARTDR